MNTHRHTKAQRRAWVIAKQNKSKEVAEILDEAGISRATLYTWIDEFKAETENPKSQKSTSKKVISSADAGDDAGRYEMLKAALAYTDAEGVATKKIVQALVRRYTMSVGQACAIVGIEEGKFEFKTRKPEVEDALIQTELSRVLAEDPGRSFEDCYALIRGTHPAWSRKQLRRIYRDEQLYRQRRRKRGGRANVPSKDDSTNQPVNKSTSLRPGATWHIGVVLKQQMWTLFIIDIEDSAVLNSLTGRGLPNEDDIRELLNKGLLENGAPRRLRIPGVPPFNQRPVTAWAWEQRIAVITLSMGKKENVALQGEMESVAGGALAEG